MGAIGFQEYLRRVYSGCSCNTATTNVWDDTAFGGTDSTDNNCPHCTNTADVIDDIEEIWRQRIERDELELGELRRISRYKEKVNMPIIPQNVINKTMNRRMMNSRH